jgi:hypothetical protein
VSAFLPVSLEFAMVLVEHYGVLEQVLRVGELFGDYDHPQGGCFGFSTSFRASRLSMELVYIKILIY